MRVRLNVYFPPALAKQIDELAIRRRISRSAIVEAAVASYLSPDGADRMEAAFARRLDRLSRQVQRLERNTGLTTEALALFVRRSEEHTSELQSLMRISYAVFCLKQKNKEI